MTRTAAALATKPTLDPNAAAPAPGDDVLFDPADDLLPPPKPAEQRPARPTVTTLVLAKG